MREYAKVSPSFWIGETGRQLQEKGPEAVIVAMYLVTSPHANMLGLYYCPIEYISSDTGLTLQGASKGLRWASEAMFCSYDHLSRTVWVHEMAKYQIEESLQENDKRVFGTRKEYKNLPKNPFLGDFYDKYRDRFHLDERRGYEAPPKPLPSQEQEQEQEQEQDKSVRGKPSAFTPPTLEQVAEYCLERKSSIDPSKWHDHYTATGWMIGKNKMKDWKAAVRTWEKNEYNSNGKSRSKRDEASAIRSKFARELLDAENANPGDEGVVGQIQGPTA